MHMQFLFWQMAIPQIGMQRNIIVQLAEGEVGILSVPEEPFALVEICRFPFAKFYPISVSKSAELVTSQKWQGKHNAPVGGRTRDKMRNFAIFGLSTFPRSQFVLLWRKFSHALRVRTDTVQNKQSDCGKFAARSHGPVDE